MGDSAEKTIKAAKKTFSCTGTIFWIVVVFVGAGMLMARHGPSATNPPTPRPPTSTPVARTTGETVVHGGAAVIVAFFGLLLVVLVFGPFLNHE